ncbi:MAG: YggS family pyridoxal phosphate-dependent enzyme [Candidatus Glassbacteria bacterium]|nr:YggS family pyridoxal phosphate-dependent enzyme [Candidatus Glassbacteria bacterium]
MEQAQVQRLADRLARVREKITEAALKAGVEPGSVTLVGVTKQRSVAEIRAAIDSGLADIGENRAQEAQEKLPSLGREVVRHFIGHLQRNKVRDVLPLFELIHSVDSARLAREIEKRAAAAGTTVKLLMQVNTSAEDSKSGVAPQEADALLEVIGGCAHLSLRGLMTIGPLEGGQARTAECFATLRDIFERYRLSAPGSCRMDVLSMGMSADYEIAIAEGSNMVRVGTAIFGPRKY